MERITLDMSAADAITAISEGNPGAVTVCAGIFRDGPTIDPDAGPMGGLGPLLNMDSLGIVGPRIWMLYKDVCGERLDVTIAMLRAWQLGFVSDRELLHSIDNRGDGVDVVGLCAQVQERLPGFQLTEGAE